MGNYTKLQKNEAKTAWMFILPLVIGVAIFSYGALFYSFGISLTRWELLTPPEFVGFKNYINLFSDKNLRQSFINTLFFVVTMVPLGTLFALFTAILLNREIKGKSFFRSAFYLPAITSTIAVSMVWLWILNPGLGVINTILRAIGIADPPRWLESIVWAKPALLIIRLWQVTGYYMLMYLAGLQNIPNELYEAGEIDGASSFQKIKFITIPLLSNTTFLVTTLLTIESFNIFESIYVITLGGPGGSTNTLMYYIYTRAFQSAPPRMGYASAIAWVLFVILMIITITQYAINKKNEQIS